MLSSASRRWRRASTGAKVATVYLALLIASQLFTTLTGFAVFDPGEPAPNAHAVEVPAMTDRGPVGERTMRVRFLRWAPEGAGEVGAGTDEGPPVILLHGSPGSASNFSWRPFADDGGPTRAGMGPRLAEAGYEAIAVDLPGFGGSSRWVPSYSMIAHARAVRAMMDELGIDRAHVIGFSMGGGVGVRLVELAPERVASLTMLASIGAQRAEGSGDYYFEHTKYAVGYGAFVILPELVPHFGLLGPRSLRHSFIRNFWDSDQRPLEPILRRFETPTLIVHGRDDFLIHDWAAELHHDITPTSSLVMLDAGHFLPFLQAEETLDHVLPFLDRHDEPGVAPLRYAADFAPALKRKPLDLGPFHFTRGTHWAVVVLLIILATFVSEDATVIAVGVLIAAGAVDGGVGLLGCFLGIVLGDGGLWAIGRFGGRRALRLPLLREWVPERSLERWGRWFDRHSIKAVFLARAAPGLRLPTYLAAGLLSRRTHGFLFWAALAALVWTPVLLVLSALIGPRLLKFFEGTMSGPLAIIVSVILILVAVRVINAMFTWTGRRRLAVDLLRLVKPEFWPVWIFYLPLGPVLAWLAIRYGPLSFTCVNPGISHGGGVVGESKREIFDGFAEGPAADWCVRTHFIQAGPEPAARAESAHELVLNDPALGGYPVIVKPDESQRGHGLRLARRRADLDGYFHQMTRPALLQTYHPGPHEAGVLWARRVGPGGVEDGGFVFSVTRKAFPEVVGDGVSTLERLIWKHPRFRMQAETFLKRFSDQTDRVLAEGETMRLAVAGNHCQGTMFLDGADLITEALERRIDEIARSFEGHADRDGEVVGGLDFGRFDIRYESDEALRRGEGFAIIELNGAMSESTNLYDPRKPLWWSYGVLFRQWATLYRIGAARRREGVRSMGLGELLRTVRDHYRGRGGPEVAD